MLRMIERLVFIFVVLRTLRTLKKLGLKAVGKLVVNALMAPAKSIPGVSGLIDVGVQEEVHSLGCVVRNDFPFRWQRLRKAFWERAMKEHARNFRKQVYKRNFRPRWFIASPCFLGVPTKELLAEVKVRSITAGC